MNHFFAYMARMKYIKRWSLMKNNGTENIQEHSLQTAMIAHCLATVKNKFYGGNLDVSLVTLLAIYHEAGEVITGDLPTPIKYYDPHIKRAYKNIEAEAERRLISTLPEELQSEFAPLIRQDAASDEYKTVKYADKICAYLKCVEELRGGNAEFQKAAKTIKSDIDNFNAPEVKYFMEKFVPSFELTLDEMEL